MLKKRCSLQMMLPCWEFLQSIVTQKLDQKKFGMETSISIDVNVDDPDAAAILDVVRKLRLTFGGKIDTGQDDLRFHAKIGLGNRDKADDSLTLQIYNVDGNNRRRCDTDHRETARLPDPKPLKNCWM